MPEALTTDPRALMYALAGGAMFLLGAALLLYERFAPSSRRFFLVSAMTSLWLLGSGASWYSPDQATEWLRLAYGVEALTGPALYWMVLLLTGARRPLAAGLAWAAGVVLMVLGLTTDLVVDGVAALLPSGTDDSLLPGVALFGLLLACVAASVLELVRAYRRSLVQQERRGHALVLTALGVSSLAFLDLLLPWLGGMPMIVTPVALTAGMVFMGVAAARYRMLSGLPVVATREVVRTMSDAVFVLDLGGAIRSTNPAAESLTGRTEPELRDLPLQELLTAAAGAEDPGISPVTRTGLLRGWRDREMTLARADGDAVTVSVSAEPLREGPRVVGSVVVVRDIRDRLQAERAMHASELRYRSLFWHNPGIAYEFAPDGTILGANPAVERMFEVPASELVGRNIWELMDPSDHDLAREVLGQVLEGNPQAYEIGLLTEDGERRLLRGVSIPVFNHDEVTSIFGVAQDATEEDRAKRDLEIQRQYFAELFESSPEAIVLAGPDGEIRRVNGEFCRLFGYTAKEAIGRQLDELIVPEDLRDEGESLNRSARLAREAGMTRAETRRVRKDGSSVDVSVLAREVSIPGEPPQMYGIYRDIGDRLEAERKLREREEELRHAQKLEAVGKLAGGVAHDFNNLLTVINGHARFALEAVEPFHDVREDLEEIERAGMRAAALTQQLLAFSRRQVLRAQVLDLNAVVEDMERMLRRLIGEHIRLETHLAADPATISGDRGQVEQVIMNLVVNARDAMPDGGLLVIRTDTTRLQADEPRVGSWDVSPGEYVRLVVEDTGSGMSPDTLARAFDPFFTTKERGKGTGLGLATVFGIVKQSGGHITAETELGAGSRLMAYLPLAKRGALTEMAEPAEARGQGADRGRTILVVEDEDAVRRLAARVLERRGYSVLTAADGYEALEVVASRVDEIDLVLSDLVMPKMGGRELADRLQEAGAAVPVIFMSGYDEEMALTGDRADAQFIAKPFTPAALVQKISAVLAGVAVESRAPQG